MLSLIVLTFIFVIVIILLSFISKRIEIKALFPFVAFLMSIILFIMSFWIGKWEGMGLGAISVSLFIAAPISIIIIMLIFRAKHK